jgi:hypothetical protein
MLNANRILSSDPLAKLIQPENFIGWSYSIDYEYALEMSEKVDTKNVLIG